MEHANWTVGTLIFLLSGIILERIFRARKGAKIFIRRIAGLSVIDEAIGRATEMGRPILFTPGLGGLDIVTFSALAVLQYIAQAAIKMGTRIMVSVCDPTVFPVAEEVCREVYTAAGKLDAFRAEDVRFLAGGQFAWAMATMGLIIREQTASNFYFGSYGAESLMLAETGHLVGAIQVAGTNDLYQIPFFIISCDYTVFGEEFFAASAYLSQEPVMLGSLVGQDIGKMIFLMLILIGAISATFTALFGFDHNWVLELLKR